MWAKSLILYGFQEGIYPQVLHIFPSLLIFLELTAATIIIKDEFLIAQE